MEGFFRVDENKIDTKEIIDYFIEVYNDTLDILTNYRNCFYILPILEIAIEDYEKHQEILRKIFYNIISSAFDIDCESEESFCKRFHSFEEIEDKMNVNIKRYFVFSDYDNSELPLRTKIENYSKTQMGFSTLFKEKSEPQIFLIFIYSWIAQIIDILIICTSLRLNPYIRFSITFHYLILIMHNFTEDINLKEMIERTIIFYIFTRTIHYDKFKIVEFTEYCNCIKDKNIISNILNKVHEREIDIFKGGIKQIESIILDEYSVIL